MSADAVNFLKNIKPKDDLVIIFNNDADGICSCVMVSKLLNLERKPFIIAQPMPTDKYLLRKIQTTIPTKIIFLDLAIDQQQSVLKKISGLCDILIIDHHQIFKNMNSKTIVHYNPRFDNPKVYQSTAYLVYKLCSKITGFSDNLWIAAVGMIGDYNLSDSQDIVKEVKEKYAVKDITTSIFRKIADIISAAKASKALTCEQMVNFIEGMKGPEEFLEGNKFMDAYMRTENEIMSIMQDAEKSSEKVGNIIFYRIKSLFNLASPISTKLSEKYPDKFVAIYEISGNKVKVSARNQSGKFNVAKIMQTALKDIKGSAGGHHAAAGATLEEKDWVLFRDKLIEIVG